MHELKRKRGNPNGDRPNVRIPPHNRLPNEVMSAIFECVAFCNLEDIFLVLGLAHICRTWRALALATPTLWTKFVCNFRLDMSQSQHRATQDISQDAFNWLGLSKSLPCHLAIRIERPHSPPLESNAQPIDVKGLDGVFASLKDRIASFSFEGCLADWHAMMAIMPDSFVSLRQLQVKFDGQWLDVIPLDCPPPTCFSQSLQLTTMSLKSFWSCSYRPRRLYLLSFIPWSQLQCLHLDDPAWPLSILLEIFQCTPNLVELKVKLLWCNAEAPLPGPPRRVCLAHLKACVFQAEVQQPFFLNFLSLPKLESLDIQAKYQLDVPLSQVLLDLHKAAPFPLKRLAVRKIHLLYEPLIQFFIRTPTIHTLELLGCGIPVNILFWQLRAVADIGTVLPRLEVVVIKNRNPQEGLMPLAAADFVETRLRDLTQMSSKSDGRELRMKQSVLHRASSSSTSMSTPVGLPPTGRAGVAKLREIIFPHLVPGPALDALRERALAWETRGLRVAPLLPWLGL